MQWPLNLPGELLRIHHRSQGHAVEVCSRLVNARSDKPSILDAIRTARRLHQRPYYRLMTYCGDKPFTGDDLYRIPKKPNGKRGWDYWLATENWAALVNDDNWGLGIYKPNNTLFIGGFAGNEGKYYQR